MEEENIIKLKKPKRSILSGCDLSIPLIVIALSVFSIVMVFSASYYTAINDFGTPYYYLKRQIIWVALGVVVMIIFAVIDYHFWLKLWIPFYILGLTLLVAVLIPGVGSSALGATRWIKIAGLTIMPGEISKPCIILAITAYFSKHPENAEKFGKGVIPVVAAGGIYCGLIMMQPNMSTGFTMLIICGLMLFAAGSKISHLGIVAGAGIAAGSAFILSSSYRYQRLLSFLDPFEDALGNGWNAVQSLVALGTGGLFGKGLGNSVQKNLYLPMAHNDFILAVIGEELGFVGIAVLILVYILLIFRGSVTAIKAKDYAGMMLASGITAWIGIQTIIHFAVVTSSMPPTGVILPFISYGGNATLLFMAAAGILINISKQKKN